MEIILNMELEQKNFSFSVFLKYTNQNSFEKHFFYCNTLIYSRIVCSVLHCLRVMHELPPCKHEINIKWYGIK